MAAAAEETLVIRRMLVCLWRGQLPQGGGKGSGLANPACNKQYNTHYSSQTEQEKIFKQSFRKHSNLGLGSLERT